MKRVVLFGAAIAALLAAVQGSAGSGGIRGVGVTHASTTAPKTAESFHQTAKKPARKPCVVRVIDNFQQGTNLFDVRQNTILSAKQIASGSSQALPGQSSPVSVLQADAQSPDQQQILGRTFPIPQNWSKAKGIGFWYYGRGTGKAVDVQLRANQPPNPGNQNWSLRWSDEFEGPAGSAPNPAFWGYDLGDGNGSGWGNHELEYYTDKPENVSMDGLGHLVITARSVTGNNGPTCYYGPCLYTSARLLTQHKFEAGYGRIEARMKVPSGAGMWPAFWALGSNIGTAGWPSSGEIDVMENVGREPYRVHGTIHGPGYSGADGITGSYDTPTPLSADFHTYTVEWQPDRITWYIDGIQYHQATPQDIGSNKWAFNHPFFLVLNLAVGGDFAGPVASDLTFPRSLLVDYVRVYTAPDSAERFQASFADNFSGWKHISLPFRAFSRASEQPTGASQDALSLHSISGYTFSVPAGPSSPVLLSGVRIEGVRSHGSCRAK